MSILIFLSRNRNADVREWACGWGMGRRRKWDELGDAIILFFAEGNGNPLQYSCLENPMDREAWQATVHGVTKSQT